MMVGLAALGAILTAAGVSYLVRDMNVLARVICFFGGLCIGAIIGCAVFVEVFANPIKRKVCGVKDTRMLR